MAKWMIRFRLIGPSDYFTPMCYLPTEETIVHAETANEAWLKWTTGEGAAPQDWYRKEEIYQLEVGENEQKAEG